MTARFSGFFQTLLGRKASSTTLPGWDSVPAPRKASSTTLPGWGR
jgi:hypothetical protein